MLFIIRGKNIDGSEFEETREGVDRFSVARAAKKEGIVVVSVVPLADTMAGKLFSGKNLFKRVSLHERIVFANNLGAMIVAGLPLSRALSIFERQTRNTYFKTIITEVRRTVDQGGTLSEGLALYPKVFSRVFVSMVAAGEESGTLPEALSIVGIQLGKTYGLRKKVSGALMYPAIILLAMVIISIFMMIYVVPSLSASFAEFGAQLPISTQLVIGTSNFLAAHTALALFSMFLSALTFVLLIRTARGIRIVHFLTLRVPAISTLVKQTNTATLARTLASLVSAGVDLIEALTITARVVPNSYYSDSLIDAAGIVEKGFPLSGIFNTDTKLYPVLLGAMSEVGEETGKLSEMLMNTALFYEEEVDSATKNLSTIIEPVLMLVIGGAVGFFAVSMIQPMYSITQSI